MKRKNYVEGGQKMLGEYAKSDAESWRKLRRWQDKRVEERNIEERLHELSLLKSLVAQGDLKASTLDRMTSSRLKRIRGSVNREKQFSIKQWEKERDSREIENIKSLDKVLKILDAAIKRKGL